MDVAKSILVSLWTAQKHQMKTMFILHILAFLHLGCVSVNPHPWRNRQSRVCISLSKSINPRYSRVTIAPGISDRDLVQERFLTRLPDQSLGPKGALNDVFSTAACHGNLWVVMMDPGCRGELEDVSMSAISALFGISWKHMTQRHSWTRQSTLKPSQPSFQGNVDVLHLSWSDDIFNLGVAMQFWCPLARMR